jgi:hypothetical protein
LSSCAFVIRPAWISRSPNRPFDILDGDSASVASCPFCVRAKGMAPLSSPKPVSVHPDACPKAAGLRQWAANLSEVRAKFVPRVPQIVCKEVNGRSCAKNV